MEDDQFSDTARDLENNSSIFVGFTASVDFPLPTDNPATADVGKPEAGNADYIVVALNNDNTLRWVTIPETRRNFPGNDVANAVAVDDFGNILVTGYTESANFVNSTLFGSFKGGRELFLAKISGFNADRDDTVLLGGSGDESGNDVVLGFGLAVVVGQTNSSDIFTREVTFLQTTYGGGDSDALIAAFAYTEFRMSRAATYFGGSGDDFGRAGFFDPNGYFHIAGATSSTDLPFDRAPSNQPIQADNGGGSFDGFLVDIRASSGFSGPSINFTSASYFGGPGLEAIATIGLNPAEPAPIDNFEPYLAYFAGFASPPDAALQRRNLISFETEAPTSAFIAAVTGSPLPQADLVVFIEDRGPLARNQEENITFTLLNLGDAPAENPSIKIDILDEAAEIVAVEYQGITLLVDPNTGFYAIPGGSIAPTRTRDIKVTLKSLPNAEAANPPGVDLIVEVATSSTERSIENNVETANFLVEEKPTDLTLEFEAPEPLVIGQEGKFTLFVSNIGAVTVENSTFKIYIEDSTPEITDLEYNGEKLDFISSNVSGLVEIGSGDGPIIIQNPLVCEAQALVSDNVISEINGTFSHNSKALESNPPGVQLYILLTNPDEPENNFTTIFFPIILEADLTVDIADRGPFIRGQEEKVPLFVSNIGSIPAENPRIKIDTTYLGLEVTAEVISVKYLGVALQENIDNGFYTIPGGNIEPGETREIEVTLKNLPNAEEANPPGVELNAEVATSSTESSIENNFGSFSFPLIGEADLTVGIADRGPFTRSQQEIVSLLVTNIGIIPAENPRIKIDTTFLGLEVTADIISVKYLGNTLQENIDTGFYTIPGGSIEPGETREIEVLLKSLPNAEQANPPGVELNAEVATSSPESSIENNFGSFSFPLIPEDQSPDIEVTIINQYVGIQIVNGSRQPQLVTELSISNIGTALASDVQLTLNTSGTLSGGIISGPPSPDDVPYTQPGLPDDPMERLVSLGDIEPGDSVNLVLKDVVADPGVDHLIGVSAMATHQSFDANLLNNSTSRDIEYQTYLQTLDYGVDFLTQTSERVMIDGFLETVVRTRLEFSIYADIGVESLPPFNLLFEHPGASFQTRLIPKDPNTPVPTSGIQCQSNSPFETSCDFSAAIARDFLVEFIDRVITPTESQVSQSRADITGDGETPSNENNNRAASTFEYNATPVADVSVTQINESGPSAVLNFRGSVTDQFLVRNLSSVETARDVLISVQFEVNPTPSVDEPIMFLVRNAGGDISGEAVQCLTSGNPVGCSIGDIEPGGERMVSITAYFQDVPNIESENPDIVGVRLKAQAAGEVILSNNQAVVFHTTEIPFLVSEPLGPEDVGILLRIRILKTGIFEKSPTLSGPWVIWLFDQEDNIILAPTTGDKEFYRGRPASGD